MSVSSNCKLVLYGPNTSSGKASGLALSDIRPIRGYRMVGTFTKIVLILFDFSSLPSRSGLSSLDMGI